MRLFNLRFGLLLTGLLMMTYTALYSTPLPTNTQPVTLFGTTYPPGSLGIEINNTEMTMYNNDHSGVLPHLWYIKHHTYKAEWLELETRNEQNSTVTGNTYFKLNNPNGQAKITVHYKNFNRTDDNSTFNYPFEITLDNGKTFKGTLTNRNGGTFPLEKVGSGNIGTITFANCQVEGACLSITTSP